MHHAGYMSIEICWLKKTRIKKDSGRNYTSLMRFYCKFTSLWTKTIHSATHICWLPVWRQAFLLQNKVGNIAKFLILRWQLRPLFMIKWQHKFKRDWSIQKFKINTMLNAFEKWCVTLWFWIVEIYTRQKRKRRVTGFSISKFTCSASLIA